MELNQVTIEGERYYLPRTDQLYKAEPQLKTPHTGDWYVYFSVWDFHTGKWLPQKWYSEHLNKKDLLGKPRERLSNGETVRKVAYNSLKSGINPKTGISISPILNKSAEELMAASTDDSPIPTIRVAVDQWIKLKSGKDNPKKVAPENKENTERTYESFFNKFLVFCEVNNVANTRLDKFPKHMVYKFFEERYSKGIIGDSTWNSQLAYIKGMFAHYAKKFDYRNLIANVEDKEVIDDSERFEPFDEQQINLIFDHLDNAHVVKFRQYERETPPNKLLAYTARTIFYTFIRVSELRRIKIKNVLRYKEGFFTLSAGIQKTKKKIFNDLYLDPRLVEQFSKLGWEKYFNDKKYENYYVFTPDMIPSIEKTGRNVFSDQFKKVLVKLNDKYKDEPEPIKFYDGNRFSLYSLKASGNIDAYNSGWDLFQISIQNRHTTTKQTETYLRKLKCNIAEKPRPERKAI